MGGRKPTSPKIVPGKFPTPEGGPAEIIGGQMPVFIGGSADFDESTGKYRSTGTRRPPQRGFKRRGKPLPKGALRGLATPPPGYEFNQDNQLVKRGGPVTSPGFPSDGASAPGFPSDGASIMPIFPRGGRRKEKGGSRRTTLPIDRNSPRRGRGGRPVGRRMLPRPRPPIDDLGPPPEREVPIPKERLPRITRESDPRGGAPFAPDERGMARDRFFERMFEKADEAKQRKSMQKEERREVRQARKEERSARRMQPREINVGNERREIGRSMIEERAARRMQPREIDVGGEIDINAERGGRRRRRRGGMKRNRRERRRDFTRRRSRMMGGRRGKSMEERAAFRDNYVSTLGGGFFS